VSHKEILKKLEGTKDFSPEDLQKLQAQDRSDLRSAGLEEDQ
jgi:hypothetical protein